MKHTCPLGIKNPNHYREDGTCLCEDAAEIDPKTENRWKAEAIDLTRKQGRKAKGTCL